MLLHFTLGMLQYNSSLRISENCDDSDSDDGTSFFGLRWETPGGWEMADFDDSNWPCATTFTNENIGVDKKIAYTNFTVIFDNQTVNVKFIW